MAKLTLSSITSAFNAITALNANFAAIVTAIENTLSRDGTSPNAMGADLDMDSNRILNLPEAAAATEPVRFGDITSLISDASINFQGAWADATAYEENDVVTNDGSSYIATSDHTAAAATEPGVGASWATVWAVIAAKGETGETGATGAAGADGSGLFDGTEATVTPAADDRVAILDDSDSDNPKYALFSDFSGGGGFTEYTAVYRNAALTVNPTTGVVLTYDTVLSDGLDLFDIGSPTIFTIPVALDGAELEFHCAFLFSNAASGSTVLVRFERDTGGGFTESFPENCQHATTATAANTGGGHIVTPPIVVSSGDAYRVSFVCNDSSVNYSTGIPIKFWAKRIS